MAVMYVNVQFYGKNGEPKGTNGIGVNPTEPHGVEFMEGTASMEITKISEPGVVRVATYGGKSGSEVTTVEPGKSFGPGDRVTIPAGTTHIRLVGISG